MLEMWTREYRIISTKVKIRFLKENYRGAISDLHIEHQEKYLKQLENESKIQQKNKRSYS